MFSQGTVLTLPMGSWDHMQAEWKQKETAHSGLEVQSTLPGSVYPVQSLQSILLRHIQTESEKRYDHKHKQR